ncbi:hypothetical protein CQW23_09348 [Capsicum baccatum]|uniref:Uncharacterized protein n=1 Tax=Capsicum baccatum TaxID=33114 RepID=A0A2G2WWM8_CAPBA|nr:hypothetical protein CQW23_09348 [Capsicum baccatum]
MKTFDPGLIEGFPLIEKIIEFKIWELGLWKRATMKINSKNTPENILVKCSYLGLELSRSRVTENAQKLEEQRLTVYNEIAVQNEALGLGSNKAYRKFEMEIARRIKTITGSRGTVSFNSAVYAYGRVIVHVTSKLVSLCVNQQLFDFLPDDREIYVDMLSPPSHAK